MRASCDASIASAAAAELSANRCTVAEYGAISRIPATTGRSTPISLVSSSTSARVSPRFSRVSLSLSYLSTVTIALRSDSSAPCFGLFWSSCARAGGGRGRDGGGSVRPTQLRDDSLCHPLAPPSLARGAPVRVTVPFA